MTVLPVTPQPAGAGARRPRRRTAVLLLVLLSALGLPTSALHAEPGSRDRFEKEMRALQILCKRGMCKRGMSRLKKLLAENEGAGFVRARQAELVDLAQRLAFGIAHPAPDADTLVSGDLKRYQPKSGRVKIVYTPKTARDFERDQGLLIHPLVFAGEYTITIEGTHYPRKAADVPQVILGMMPDPETGRDHTWQVLFGIEKYVDGQYERWMPARVTLHEGEAEPHVLKEKDPTHVDGGSPYKLEIRMRRDRVECKVGRLEIFEFKKPKKLFGRFAFQVKNWKTVEIEGVIEPSWIQGLVDASSEGERETFLAEFDPRSVLPDWVFEAPPEEEDIERRPLPDRPGRLPEALNDPWGDVITAFRTLDRAALPDLRDQLVDVGGPSWTVAFVDALQAIWRFDLEQAEALFRKAHPADRSFAMADFLRGVVQHVQGESQDAAEILGTVRKDYQAPEVLYQALIQMFLQDGRIVAARRVSGLASEHGIESATKRLLDEALTKAANGPAWQRVNEYKSPSYHVMSDLNREVCRDVGRMLEAMFKAFRRDLEDIGRDDTRRFRVYIFSGEAGFNGYMGRLRFFWGGGGGRAAGVYSPFLKQLLIWNLPSRELLMETVRHEGFHQYLDRVLPDAPTWFNEGMAVYYETAKVDGYRVTFGEPNRRYAKMLLKEGRLPIKRFLGLSHEAFYERGELAYAQAWSMVYALRHTSQGNKDKFRRYLDALGTMSPAKALARVFPGDGLDELHEDVELHLEDWAE